MEISVELPEEERESLETTALLIAGNARMFLGQQVYLESKQLGLDFLAETYLAQRAFELLCGDDI